MNTRKKMWHIGMTRTFQRDFIVHHIFTFTLLLLLLLMMMMMMTIRRIILKTKWWWWWWWLTIGTDDDDYWKIDKIIDEFQRHLEKEWKAIICVSSWKSFLSVDFLVIRGRCVCASSFVKFVFFIIGSNGNKSSFPTTNFRCNSWWEIINHKNH